MFTFFEPPVYFFANDTKFWCQICHTSSSSSHVFIIMIKCYLSNSSVFLSTYNINHGQPFKYLYNKNSIAKCLLNGTKANENIVKQCIVYIWYDYYTYIKNSK